MIDSSRYPLGKKADYLADPARDRLWQIHQLESLPSRLRDCFDRMDPSAWDTPYRVGGWTGRQVMHHLADSHMNAFMRMKLALTEDLPTLKPYDENRWALTPDVTKEDPEASLWIMHGLHRRMTTLLSSLDEGDWQRVCYHPESKKTLSLESLLATYAWHGDHHLGHLEIILAGRGS